MDASQSQSSCSTTHEPDSDYEQPTQLSSDTATTSEGEPTQPTQNGVRSEACTGGESLEHSTDERSFEQASDSDSSDESVAAIETQRSANECSSLELSQAVVEATNQMEQQAGPSRPPNQVHSPETFNSANDSVLSPVEEEVFSQRGDHLLAQIDMDEFLEPSPNVQQAGSPFGDEGEEEIASILEQVDEMERSYHEANK